ncbi:MAG: BCD family MFS transporter [Chloroflexi bacterium]|nr:BCD family MFS transporter [Chloroflexota bacterium]
MNSTTTNTTANTSRPAEINFRLTRLLRLATFQIGSALGDILVTSIWNRIMINELGLSATPVGLLIALRYLIAPLGLWAGYWSDTRPWLGLHRTPYIWAGRLLVVLSYPLLPLSLSRFAMDRGDVAGWLVAILCFVMYGTGTLLSGSPFLALVRDSVPRQRQGVAISMMETALIVMFPIAAIGLGRAMSHYSLATFWAVTLTTMGISAFFWFFAVAGMEQRHSTPRRETARQAFSFGVTFRKIWRDPDTQRFFVFLALATLAAWAQDAILEPFGAQVLKQDIEQTTRYSAYWQTATVIFLIGSAIWFRRRPPEAQVRITQIGLGLMSVGMIVLAASAFGAQVRVLQIALVIFGIGFGLYTFGGFSLLIAMTSDSEAGTYLGLWTICVLLSRGIGIGLGGILRDVLLALTNSLGLSYGLIFGLEALGLAAAVFALARVDVLGFGRRVGRARSEQSVVSADLSL